MRIRTRFREPETAEGQVLVRVINIKDGSLVPIPASNVTSDKEQCHG